jgi:hypothetical protein
MNRLAQLDELHGFVGGQSRGGGDEMIPWRPVTMVGDLSG